jgi:hypothetical protein
MKADPSCPKGMNPRLWAALCEEHEQEFISELVGRIKQGAHKSGARLTASECWVLLQMLQPKPKRLRGRPVNDPNRVIYMALNCVRLESKGMPPKNAVKAIADAYGVKRSTVYNARRKMIGNESN